MDYSTCPCCGKKVSQKTLNTYYQGIIGVHECPHCGAVFGQCYLGDSYRVVLPYWAEGNVPPENTFYYDLTTLGGSGIDRRHGWADKTSRRIVQVG